MRVAILLVVLAATLLGCATSDVGGYLVQPGKYQFLRCQDLAAQASSWLAREKELSSLVERASEGTGGSLIGAAVYGPDLAAARAHLRLVYQTMREKNCDGAQNNPTSGAVLR